MTRLAGHALWVVALTILTQLGGLAWLAALAFRRRWLAFAAIYTTLAIAAVWVAPLMGRVPLPCSGETLRMQSWLYCAMNRHYVVPEMAEVLQDAAQGMQARHPGTEMLILDGSFPFLAGFPMLPHLSHTKGRSADIAFFYADENGPLPGRTRSPIGYFAFEPGSTQCPDRWPTLRWNFDWLQPAWPNWRPDRARMKTLMGLLSQDRRVRKILLEPHLVAAWGVGHSKVRFQGCRAARHDDHIHIQM